jgi:hypothetical protein
MNSPAGNLFNRIPIELVVSPKEETGVVAGSPQLGQADARGEMRFPHA